MEELARGGALEVIVRHGLTEAELIAQAPEFSAFVVRSQTTITAPILQPAKRLKVVGLAGLGVGKGHVDAPRRRRVTVIITPVANTL